MIEWGPEFGSSEAVINGFSRELASASDILSKAHRRGVMMMAGTDEGQSYVPYGEWHARELECMMTYIGMTMIEAIRSARANADYSKHTTAQNGTELSSHLKGTRR